MTLQQLKYIVSIANSGSFSIAADQCFVNQSTITIQVKKLETEMGVKLFNRSKNPVSLTQQGERLIDKARMVLREIDQMKAIVTSEKESVKGTFRIGVIPTLSPYIIPDFCGDFTKENSETSLEIEEMESTLIIDQLKSGKIDIGILVTPLGDRNLREVVLYNEPFVFYGNQLNPLLFKNEIAMGDLLEEEDLWLLKDGHCFKNQVLNICENQDNDDRLIRFESGSIETLKQMVKKYGGHTLIPEMSINKLDRDNIVHFESPKPTREVSLVVHNDFAREQLLVNIRKSILKIVPKSFAKNERFISVKWR